MQERGAPLILVVMLTGAALGVVGCGTTRSSDTGRTATEQLLISDAIDRAVETVDLKALSGQKVFFDDSRLSDAVDKNYLISSMRQHLLANGCMLCDRDKADFIVEARAGAVGTDRNDLLFGIPSTNVPQVAPMQTLPASIPEIPIAKRRDQRGIVKIAVFAYHRETGTPVWQSGLVHQESTSNDVWILGAGPFQRGSIYEGTAFAGKQIKNDHGEEDEVDEPRRLPAVAYANGRMFTSPTKLVKPPEPEKKPEEPALVAQAGHEEKKAKAPAKAPADPPAAAPTEQTAEAPAATPPPAEAQPAPPAPLPATAEAALPMPGPASSAPAPTPAAVANEPKSVYLPAGTSTLPQPRFQSP